MKRSKASKGIAEKALAAAIADGTAQIQRELAKANARNAFLEGLLVRIGAIAKTGQPAAVAGLPAAIQRPEFAVGTEPEVVVSTPKVPLADEDDLGEGRWA